MAFSAIDRHGMPAPHWQPPESLPREEGMILADPAKAKTTGTIGVSPGSKARGPCSKHRRNTARRSGPLELGPHPGNAQKSLWFPDALDNQAARERITALRIRSERGDAT
jgi:hypothetical protein